MSCNDAVWTMNLIRKTYNCDCENEQGGEGESEQAIARGPLIAKPFQSLLLSNVLSTSIMSAAALIIQLMDETLKKQGSLQHPWRTDRCKRGQRHSVRIKNEQLR